MTKTLTPMFLIVVATVYAQTGTLSVSITDPSSKAIAGARVTITALPVYDKAQTKTSFPHYNAFAITPAAGTANFPTVPIGIYAVCAFPTGEQVVDSCSWVSRPRSAVVTASAVTVYKTQLQQAARVTVLVNDSKQILASAVAPKQALQLGVSAERGHWVPLRKDLSAPTAQTLFGSCACEH